MFFFRHRQWSLFFGIIIGHSSAAVKIRDCGCIGQLFVFFSLSIGRSVSVRAAMSCEDQSFASHEMGVTARTASVGMRVVTEFCKDGAAR